MFDVRQITARVNAGTKRIGRCVYDSAGAELMARSFQAWIRFVGFWRLHEQTLAHWLNKGQRNVAQFSKTAVSPISKSAPRLRVGKPATQQTWKSALQSVAQFSKTAVSPISKSAPRLRVGKPATQQTWKSALRWAAVFATMLAFSAPAQTNPPPVSYFRSYVNDIPNEPLVTVSVSGASNVSCCTIEEDLPSPASAVSVSSGGVWLPSIGAIRWGPFFNTVSNSVSYRLTGPAGSYPSTAGRGWTANGFFRPE